jgi:hypothetical protein
MCFPVVFALLEPSMHIVTTCRSLAERSGLVCNIPTAVCFYLNLMQKPQYTYHIPARESVLLIKRFLK